MMTNRMCRGMLSLAACTAMTAGVAMAQITGGGPAQPNTTSPTLQETPGTMANSSGSMGNGKGSTQDKMFAKKALAGGMTEIQAAQLALTKSNSDDVKQFAQKMIDDHTKMADQMKPLAMEVGVQPPTMLMPKDQSMINKLQNLNGADFDKAYIKDMVKDHQEDDKEFMKEASSGQNQDIKMAAQQGDTIIKQHLDMIQGIAKAHNVM
jgi:putative membrane protein